MVIYENVDDAFYIFITFFWQGNISIPHICHFLTPAPFSKFDTQKSVNCDTDFATKQQNFNYLEWSCVVWNGVLELTKVDFINIPTVW